MLRMRMMMKQKRQLKRK